MIEDRNEFLGHERGSAGYRGVLVGLAAAVIPWFAAADRFPVPCLSGRHLVLTGSR